MIKRRFVAIVVAGALSGAGAGVAVAQPKSGYATVNGMEMYYEVHGAGGQPLLLLHGAFMSIDSAFGKMLPTLSENRRVVAVELQGHGRTADIDRPFRIRQMADDVAALMDEVGVAGADIFGYSMGGAVALQVAVRHPERVRKLVVAASGYSSAGIYPEVFEAIEAITPEAFAGSPWEAEYLRLAPNPEDWPVLIDKIKEMDANIEDWPAADIRGIAAPTLLIFGDHDIVPPEHIVDMFKLRGGGVPGDMGTPLEAKAQLAVLPGTTHISLMQRTDWLLSMVGAFLAAPMPKSE